MKLQPKEIISQRYEILELLGVGGMANVYCAKDLKLDRKVTFKVLKEEFIDEEFIGKFRKEARAAAKMTHINIANVYDVGNDDKIHYIVMEYIDGYTLKDIIKSKAPFSNEEVLGISIQIANALEMAHSNDIVHRDIKPQNILVTKEGGVKVTDFGIARATSSQTITTEAMGSAHYFSPEQARGSYVDFKSDIYSLGIIMYEMVTGELPFDGDGVVQLAMQHINDPIPNMKEKNINVSNSLEKIILKATSKNVDKRYISTKDFNIDLKRALSDESGNFIKENDFDENAQTVVIKPEELEQINRMIDEKENKSSTYSDKNIDEKEKIKTKKIVSNNINTEKSMDKKVTLWAIITSIIVIVLISGILVFNLSAAGTVKTPNFVGKTWEEAEKIARDKEIYITNTKEDFSDGIAEGSIIEQEINAKMKIKKGTNINVTISVGNDKFKLEDFTGLDISEVYRKVEKLPIDLKEEYIYDEKIEIGKIIRQTPSAGKTVDSSTEVTLYISRGQESGSNILVPNLIGIEEEEAKALIKTEGLSIGRISKAESSSVEKGKVISQSINYGNEVSEGTAISIVVSTGGKEETKEETKSETVTQPILQETTKEETKEATTENIEQTTADIIKVESLIINPVLPADVETVDIKVVKVLDGQSSVVWSSNHNKSKFPLEISVSGSKPTKYELYIDGKLIGTETKNFN